MPPTRNRTSLNFRSALEPRRVCAMQQAKRCGYDPSPTIFSRLSQHLVLDQTTRVKQACPALPETLEQRVDPHVLRNHRHRDRLISQFEKPRGVILAVHID